MSDECKCGFDHWPLPCNDENPPNKKAARSFAAPTGYMALVNALREAVLRLEEWGPAPADAFWINEVAKPLIKKYSKLNTP